MSSPVPIMQAENTQPGPNQPRVSSHLEGGSGIRLSDGIDEQTFDLLISLLFGFVRDCTC